MGRHKVTKFMLESSHYDKKKADYAVSFIQYLCHIDCTIKIMDYPPVGTAVNKFFQKDTSLSTAFLVS